MVPEGGHGSRRGQLRLDLFTRVPEWQPENRPRLALVWNIIFLLGLTALGVYMGYTSYNERPIVGTTGGWANGIVRIPPMEAGQSNDDLLKPKHQRQVRSTICTCTTARQESLAEAGCVETTENVDTTVVMVADETAAPLAEDIWKGIREDNATKPRYYPMSNIDMTVVQERLGFTWSWNPTARNDSTNTSDQNSVDLANTHLQGACYGAQGYEYRQFPTIEYTVTNRSVSTRVPLVTFPPKILTLEAGYKCNDCSNCHWDNITGHFNTPKYSWLRVEKWAAFIPHGETGGGCFQNTSANGTKTTVDLNPNGNYTGRLIMTLDPTRPMPRLINALLEGLTELKGIETAGFPFDIADSKYTTPNVLRARDVHPYASVETLQTVTKGVYNYVIVDRGDAEWLALRERYPNIAEKCCSMSAEKCSNSSVRIVYKSVSKACCGGTSAASAGAPQGGLNTACVPFKTRADCKDYVSKFGIFPNDDELCVDATDSHTVPVYAYKKVYNYSLESADEMRQLWKKAENPWSELLFNSTFNMSRADNNLYAGGVCTNSYKGELDGDIIYLLECSSHGVCWKTGKYHYVWDPPGTMPHVNETLLQLEKQVYCTYNEELSFQAWAVSNVGSILGSLRGLIFLNMMLYAAINIAPAVADAVKEAKEANMKTMPYDVDSQLNGGNEGGLEDVTGIRYVSCDPVFAEHTAEQADCEDATRKDSSSIRRRALL